MNPEGYLGSKGVELKHLVRPSLLVSKENLGKMGLSLGLGHVSPSQFGGGKCREKMLLSTRGSIVKFNDMQAFQLQWIRFPIAYQMHYFPIA